MDPKHTGDVFKHLEKQNELLKEAYTSMSQELHTLQVEEEMLMRKYYEFMVAQDLIDKTVYNIINIPSKSNNAKEHDETDQAEPLIIITKEQPQGSQ